MFPFASAAHIDTPPFKQSIGRIHSLDMSHAPVSAEPHCASCVLQAFCLPGDLEQSVVEQLDKLVCVRRRIQRGQFLYHAGDAFENIYAVRAGSFKTLLFHRAGREQVTGFQMAGNLLGLDGLSTRYHICDAIALEDSQVCVIPFQRLEHLGQDLPLIQHQVHRLLGEEIAREHRMLMLLGNMQAEERLATFLLDFSDHLAARGYSPRVFNLRVTREEIGNYLGLKMETISRVFSRFQKLGLICVNQKEVKILDLDGLRTMVD